MSDQEVSEAIRRQIDVCTWEMLVPHFAHGMIVVVREDLDFFDTALRIAKDDAAFVKEQMASGGIVNANDEHLKNWNLVPEKKFNMVVTHPYVLIQEILES